MRRLRGLATDVSLPRSHVVREAGQRSRLVPHLSSAVSVLHCDMRALAACAQRNHQRDERAESALQSQRSYEERGLR